MKKHSTILLDLTGCKGILELQERIRVAFEFPFWYGKNWDAFYDLLQTDVSADKIIIKGVQTMPEKLQEYFQTIYLILDKEVKECERYNWPFSYEIVD